MTIVVMVVVIKEEEEEEEEAEGTGTTSKRETGKSGIKAPGRSGTRRAGGCIISTCRDLRRLRWPRPLLLHHRHPLPLRCYLCLPPLPRHTNNNNNNNTSASSA